MCYFTKARALRIGPLTFDSISLPPAISKLRLGGWPNQREGTPSFLRLLLAFVESRPPSAKPLRVTIDRFDIEHSIIAQDCPPELYDKAEADVAVAESLDILAAEGRKLTVAAGG